MSGSLLLGYAYRRLLRVDHLIGSDPDPVICDVDPSARRLPGPPAGVEESHRLGPSTVTV